MNEACEWMPVHIDPRRLSSLPGRFGGHGTMPHTGLWWDSAYYGSFAAVWHFSRAWCGPLRGAQLAQAGQGRHLTALQAAWDRIAEAHTRMQRRGDLAALLPDDAHFPEMHSRLQHGRVSPASVPLGQLAAGGLDDDSGDSPSLLYDLDSCDTACHTNAQRASTAVAASHDFLSLHDDPSTTAKMESLQTSADGI